MPVSDGRFDLDDYIVYIVSIMHFLGGDAHVIAVCQPSVPVLAAVALMAAGNDPDVPHSMVLLGGPSDSRRRGLDSSRADARTVEGPRRSIAQGRPDAEAQFCGGWETGDY